VSVLRAFGAVFLVFHTRSRGRLVSALAISLVVALLVAASSAGCEKETWKPKEADRRLILVAGEKMTLHTGKVGEAGEHQSEATYVLVDAKNPSDKELSVTLGGVILDATGAVLGKLERQSLRLGPGDSKTFALVDDAQGAHPTATGATIEVSSAVELDYPEQIVISDLHEYPDGDRIVVKAYVKNTVGRIGRAVVFATFYGEDGRPMQRPSTLFTLERHAQRGVQFVGPAGSVRATMAIGDIVY
jgi:hypothetical protein